MAINGRCFIDHRSDLNKYPKPSILVPGTKSEKYFLCHGMLIISSQKRGGIRGYFVPWHKWCQVMAKDGHPRGFRFIRNSVFKCSSNFKCIYRDALNALNFGRFHKKAPVSSILNEKLSNFFRTFSISTKFHWILKTIKILGLKDSLLKSE